MMRFRSSSSPSRSGALALTLLLAGGGCLAEWAEDDAHVDLRVDQPGGLGFEIEVSGRNRDELFLYLDAHLTNLGAEPCHVAIFLHTSEPVREDMPALSGPPAPVVAVATKPSNVTCEQPESVRIGEVADEIVTPPTP